MHGLGIKTSMIDMYINAYTWPKLAGYSGGQDVFGAKRVSSWWKDWTLKASASECLTITPVLAKYFRALADGHSDAEVRQHSAALMLLFKSVELMLRTTRRRARKRRGQRVACLLCMHPSGQNRIVRPVRKRKFSIAQKACICSLHRRFNAPA